MTKPRAQTIQQRFGFMDHDLKSPMHDEMIIWLDANIAEVLQNFISFSNDWTEIDERKTALIKAFNSHRSELEHRIGEMKNYLSAGYDSADDELSRMENKLSQFLNWAENFDIGNPPPKPPFEKTIEVRWEYAISTDEQKMNPGKYGNKYIIGFIDLVAWIKPYTLGIKGMPFHNKPLEWPNISWRIFRLQSDCRFNFEVKTKIESAGELLRQIRMYQEYTSGKFVVVSPDTRFRSAIEGQDILFFEYPHGR